MHQQSNRTTRWGLINVSVNNNEVVIAGSTAVLEAAATRGDITAQPRFAVSTGNGAAYRTHISLEKLQKALQLATPQKSVSASCPPKNSVRNRDSHRRRKGNYL